MNRTPHSTPAPTRQRVRVAVVPRDAADTREAAWSARLAAAGCALGLPGGRLACAAELIERGELGPASLVLDRLTDAREARAGVAFLRAEIALRGGDASSALRLSSAQCAPAPLGELRGPQLAQLARCGRAADAGASVLPVLLSWLASYPDTFDAGAIWLEVAITALHAAGTAAQPDAAEFAGGPPHTYTDDVLSTAERALAAARALLGNVNTVQRIACEIATHRAALLLATPSVRRHAMNGSRRGVATAESHAESHHAVPTVGATP